MGPLGRAAEASLGAAPGGGGGPNQARPATAAPIYTYSLSKGFYAGVSLDGKIIVSRPKVNEKFYGTAVTASQILRGVIPIPPAAQPLYEALTRCHFYATGDHSSTLNQRRNQVAAGGSMLPPPASSPFPPVAPFNQPQYQMQDPDMGEYGEVRDNNGAGEDNLNPPGPTIARMPPAQGDQHSYAGMSDITSEPGY